MATLHKEIIIRTGPAAVWSAVRDIGALHTRLVPGFVTDCRVEGDDRVVTFGNGMIIREPILSVDDERKRLAWAAVGGVTTHYNAVMEVHALNDGNTRVTWTSDFLPHERASAISSMQDAGLAAMKATLERGS